MTDRAPAPTAGARVATGLGRVRSAWRALPREQRFAAGAALALVFTLFLPWYSRTFPVSRGSALRSDAQSAIAAFTWVEAAILLVALAVLYLLWARAERRAFHLPGGDGTIIMAAGAWAGALIVWRLFDKPELGRGVAVGLRWGIFVALAAAALLAYAGARIRAAHRPEPPLHPGESDPAGAAVRISDDRPHLAETQVMGDRAETQALPDRAQTQVMGDRAETDVLPERAPTEALPSRPPPDQLPPG